MHEGHPDPGRESSTSLQAERRAYVRVESSLAAGCRPAGRGAGAAWPGKVRDISPGGVGLLLRHRFAPGTALIVELRDGNGKVLRTASVRVVHATAAFVEGSHHWLLGCAFDRPLGEEEFRALV
jgi:hypothetical protein